MNLKKFKYLGLLVIGLLTLGALMVSNFAAQAGVPSSVITAGKGKISSAVIDATENGQSTSYVILLTSQADLSAAYGMKDEDARGWYVYNTLRSHADTTQAPLRAYLAAQGIPYQSYWAANMIIASGNRASIESVAARNDVRIIESNAPHRWIEEPSVANLTPSPDIATTIEWGVANVNAPAVWAMGFTGQGIVIGNQDTGMRWTHNAIKPQYRGWNGTTADHNYNWHDSIHSGGGSCGFNATAPCDDSGHGTHTTGTTAGYDGGTNQVGVAPGAKWIGCRNMDVGNGTPATYTECFQFFLAPTDLAGNNPNPALRPHVMNNSWGCPTSEGCAANSLQTIVESSTASGIFVEVSAGNSGSGCSSVDTPPAIYSASFSTGAYDITNTLAAFSSRGPVTVDGSNRMKPDISGPGVNVRSSLPTSDTSYGSLSGTSMAGPHVVGVVALLWSADPALSRQITQTKNLLQSTANHAVTVSNGSACGGTPIPNNHFGYGRVDALAAVNAAGGGTATPTSAVPTATNTTAVATNTPAATNTAVATGTTAATNTPGATPTCTAGLGTWAAGADLPSTLTRAYGAYFPANGKFYTLGGRTGDGDPALAQLQPLEYNPATNTWVQKTAVFSDVQTSNVSGGILTVSGTPVIAIVGGSAGGGTTGTTEMRYYNPVADTMTTVATDPWTPGATTLPGGTAVYNNKLYVFGGFVINVGMSNQIWQYDPAAAAGSRWTLKTATLPTALGYIPAATVGSFIYTIGGSEWDGTTLIDSAVAYKYDPTADTIVAVASTPRATGETRALTIDGKVWVFGGGRVAPNPGNQVEIYDPVANTYSTGPAFTTARRNFPIATDGSKIFLAGGYDSSGTTLLASMEIYTPAACATPGPTNTSGPTSTATATTAATSTATGSVAVPTNTAVATGTTGATNTVVATSTTGATNTAVSTSTPGGPTETPQATNTPGSPTATATACTIEFADVLPGNTFYASIHCLACQGIINGYPCGGDGEPCNGTSDPYFRPSNNITRGQLAKVVSQSAGFNEPVTGQTFEDVAPGTTFYDYIERLASRGVMGGYPCGVDPNEPCGNGNLPYFRPGANATRGQLTKIVSNAAGFSDPDPSTFTFTDVPPGSTFHLYVERLLINRPGAMSGYPCSSPAEPCDDQNRPYFRPSSTLTRGQTSKIVTNTFFPDCALQNTVSSK